MPVAVVGFCQDTVMCVSSKASGGTTTLIGGLTAAWADAETMPMANATIDTASLSERLMVFSLLLFMVVYRPFSVVAEGTSAHTIGISAAVLKPANTPDSAPENELPSPT